MATFNWRGTGTDFGTPVDWFENAVPGTGATVDMNVSAAAVAIGPGNSVALKVLAGGTARFGTTDPNTGTAALSIARAGQGVVTVDGTGSQLLLSGVMYAGRACWSSGTLT